MRPARGVSRAPSGSPDDELDSIMPGAEKYIRRLQAALTSGSAARFAALIEYPIEVGTRSGCVALIEDAEAFVGAFDAIVTSAVRRAILHARPPFRAPGKGLVLGQNAVLIRNSWKAGAPRIVGIVSELERIEGFTCHGRTRLPLPGWLDGTWEVVSVSNPDRATQDRTGQTIAIDVGSKRVEPQTFWPELADCAIEAFYSFDPGRHPIWHLYPSSVSEGARVLRVECVWKGKSTMRELDVAGDGLLVEGVGMNPHWYLRQLEEDGATVRVVGEGRPCGKAHVRCAKGLVCVAGLRPHPAKGVEEICRAARSL